MCPDRRRDSMVVMITVHSEDHRAHDGGRELSRGELVPSRDDPSRAEKIVARVREVGLGEVIAPDRFGSGPVTRVHARRYVEFLRTAHERWREAYGDEGDAVPQVWPARTLRQREPEGILGKLGYYAFDAGTPITAGAFAAASTAADVALTGARLLRDGARAAFALCRPPGHHAGRDLYGGYCFLNNAAIAAQWLLDAGAARVAIVDVDYHHGNGTQAIFYDRADVLFVSLHAHPDQEYPYFLGHADETGAGPGVGLNLNLPMRWGTDWARWSEALAVGLARVADFAPEALVVSLGVDTYEGDPFSRFALRGEHFVALGERVAGVGLPTLFVMEGGYAVEELGVNVVNVLAGFETAAGV